MKRNLLLACVFVLLALSLAGIGRACTTFCIPYEGKCVFGKNLDWMVEDGLVVVNKSDVSKVSLDAENPFSWTSKYGSVTFNMYGCGMPMGGINEAGLVIENMWLAGTVYPTPDSRAELSTLEWVQYQLDTAATVDEVIASDSEIRIGSQNAAPLHFLICDGKGDCAAIEYLDGKMVCHTKDKMPVTALTNDTYDESLGFLAGYAGEDTSEASRAMGNSLGRFVIAAERLKEYDLKESAAPVDYAFATLDSVSNDGTQWSIVYDPKNRRVHFRTRSNREIRRIDLDAFDYSCNSPVKVLDMLGGKTGDVSKAFVDYSYELNNGLIQASYSKTGFLKDIPQETLQFLARHPESMQCVK